MLKKANISLNNIDCIVSTGYGRVVVPFAHKNIAEISCHAKGAHWFSPQVRTILDMGGQDCKAIRCDATGKVTDLGRNSLELVNGEVAISSTCVVFARSEVLGYLC